MSVHSVHPSYRPIVELGRGGMSKVYLGINTKDERLPRLAVLKLLLPDLARDAEFVEMFLDEARLSSRLNHRNVVRIYEIVGGEDEPCMLMEFLDGASLEALVRRSKGTLPLGLHLRVISESARGLQYAHDFVDSDGSRLRIIHRDVSPHNVYVTFDGEVKVLDFGIAKASDSAHRTRTGVLKGKCAYMAPEQVKDSRNVDSRVDVFALGVMLWQAAAGRRMWNGLSELEIFERLARQDIPKLPVHEVPIDKTLASIVERATAPERERRYATAGELANDLEAFLARFPQPNSTADLGAYIGTLMADRRGKVRAVIESALRDARVDQPAAIHSQPLVPHGVAISLPSQSGAVAVSRMNIHDVGGNRTPASVRTEVPVVTGRASAPPPPRAADRRLALVAAAAGLLAAAALMFAFVSRPRVAVPPAQAVATASDVADVRKAISNATVAPVAPDPTFIELSLSATPTSARIYIDDAALDTNPARLKFPLDGRSHSIRAEAPGYVPSLQNVNYDTPSKRVSIVLAKKN